MPYLVSCHEKTNLDDAGNLSVFGKKVFHDLGEAKRYAVKAIEAIKATREAFPVDHPVMVVTEKKTGRAKYRVDLTPTGEIIETPLV